MGWLRLDLVRLLLLGLPALALNWWLVGATVPFAESPVRAAMLVLPLLGAALVLSKYMRRDTPVTLGTGFLAFFVVYCLGFSALISTDPLIGRRTLSTPQQDDLGYTAGEEQLGGARLPFLVSPLYMEWLRGAPAFNRLGDWHYWFAPEAPPVTDLLVLTLPTSQGEFVEARRRFAFLIRRAVQEEAKGIAFDYYLERSTAADPLLALILKQAREAGVPVLFGYRPRLIEGALQPTPVPERLTSSLPLESLGHLAGYREADETLRMVPLSLSGAQSLLSLSLRIAEILHGGPLVPAPTQRLFQFNRPIWGVPTTRFSTDPETATDWSVFRGRFVVVGNEAAFDLRRTPFGPIQGVEIHASAAHSLRSGSFISRLDSRYIFPILFAACYVLTLLYARGSPNRKLLTTCVALTGMILGAAALAMQTSLLWITVSYPLVAIWLLAGLLIAARAVRRGRSRPGTVPASPGVLAAQGTRAESDDQRPGAPREIEIVASTPPEEEAVSEFDVFLSHNSRDKPQVKEIALALREQGLEPWLDVWELTPGRDWQFELEEILRTVRSSAVFVGSEGLGPWEIPEMRACLSECVRRGLPVIPVLLPGTPKQPELPLFLTQFTWVDLRLGVTESGLDRLQWGITGVQPKGMREA